MPRSWPCSAKVLRVWRLSLIARLRAWCRRLTRHRQPTGTDWGRALPSLAWPASTAQPADQRRIATAFAGVRRGCVAKDGFSMNAGRPASGCMERTIEFVRDGLAWAQRGRPPCRGSHSTPSKARCEPDAGSGPVSGRASWPAGALSTGCGAGRRETLSPPAPRRFP